MTRITLDLLRKRCEHNEGLIHNLEELSLHQDSLEEIENLDKWCRELKILYLQGNSIQKIENLNRLKNLEYLNLALNSIERINHLEGCESLKKLDLTANFIGDLTSVENLRQNCYLEELFLTGNPCAEYGGYRMYVIGALPQLKVLDGQEVTRTEQLQALHNFLSVKARIITQQNEYKGKRETERQENLAKMAECSGDNPESWEDLTWSPEYRLMMNRQRDKDRDVKKDQNKSHEKSSSSSSQAGAMGRVLPLCNASGQVMNVNEPRLEFILREDESEDKVTLDVAVFRHLDTSLIDVDIHPNFVIVEVKGKLLQLRLSKEVLPHASVVQRSRTTGKLLISMPLTEPVLKISKQPEAECKKPQAMEPDRTSKAKSPSTKVTTRETLEIDPLSKTRTELRFVGKENAARSLRGTRSAEEPKVVRSNSPGFLDDPDVPGLV